MIVVTTPSPARTGTPVDVQAIMSSVTLVLTGEHWLLSVTRPHSPALPLLQSSTPADAKQDAPAFGFRLVAVGHSVPPVSTSSLLRLEHELSHATAVVTTTLLSSSVDAEVPVDDAVHGLLNGSLLQRGLSSDSDKPEATRLFLEGLVHGGDADPHDEVLSSHVRSGRRLARCLASTERTRGECC